MKKILMIFAMAAVTCFATSCSKDNVSPAKNAKAVTVATAGDKSDVGTNQYPPPPQ